MDKSVFRHINFDSIVLGSLISADCGGVLLCSKTEKAFQLKFQTERNEQFVIVVEVQNVKKIFKTYSENQLVLDYKLKPSAIKEVGDVLKKSGYVFQISKNSEEAKFQLYLNDISDFDVSFIEGFYESIDIFDENVAKTIKEPEQPEQPEPQLASKTQKPSILKSRKKKLLNLDPEDGSQDYYPQKRPRKQIFSKITADCEVIEEVPKRSLRVKNRDEVNLCEEMSEEAQIQEALKRSLKTADQTVIDSISHIEDSKSEQDLEHDEIYDNVDKAIELFTYNTSNGDIIVRMEDYLCLSRNEYLNDVIIDFYLHYLYNVKMTPEQREKTIIIGAHFYTLYATSSEYSGWNDGLNAGLNAKEKRYRRIDGILKADVNIFEKDFIIMPLMDHNHWFLAIVCFPKLNGSFTIDGNIKVDENDVKRNPKKVSQPPIKSSCVLIFDSVKGNGSRRTVAINHIKNFLEYEWINKYHQEFHFDVKCLNGHSPKVPLQTNNVDCGCFILEFMERFFVTSPINDYRFPIDLSDWFSSQEVRSSKRRELAAVIKTMMELSNNQIELPKIRFYGDRKRKSSKSVQLVNLDSSLEDNNNGNIDKTFHVPENGHSAVFENGNNGNNNDETFNNNNDFNCLDSNNILQNNNVIHENQEAVHNISKDEEYVEAEVERISTQEMIEYEQQCCIEDDGNIDSILLDTSDEMEVDEVAGNVYDAETEMSAENEAKLNFKIVTEAETGKKDAISDENTEKFTETVENNVTTPEIYTNGLENHGELSEEFSEQFDKNDSIVTVIDANDNKNDSSVDGSEKTLVSDAKVDKDTKVDVTVQEGDTKTKNDARAAKGDAEDAKLDVKQENDKELDANNANANECDTNEIPNVDAIEKVESNEVFHLTSVKIDLTNEDFDVKAKIESNNKISDEIKYDKMDVNPEPEEEQNNDQDEPEKEQETNQKSVKIISVANRISQNIKLTDSNIVLFD